MDVLTFIAFLIDRILIAVATVVVYKKRNKICGLIGFKSSKSDGSSREFIVHGNIENSG
jgi:hypothetical protein